MAPPLLAMVESRLRPREDVDLGQHGVPLAGMIISVILAMLSLVIISSFLSKLMGVQLSGREEAC